MKQNGVFYWLGPGLLFFIFRFEYLVSGPKVTGTFEKRAPGLQLAGILNKSVESEQHTFTNILKEVPPNKVKLLKGETEY